jgi:PEGA domain
MDSRPIGVTPLQVSAPTGDRILEVEYHRSARRLPVTVRRGEIVRQRVEFIVDAPAAAAPVLGAIAVASDGGRAPVLVDGTARGLSPVVVNDLQPGDHTVTVMFPTGKIERTIRVDGGVTASLAVTMPPAPRAVSGWLQVDVKERLQIIEDGKLIGTTEFERLMLPAGHHTLDLTNPELGFSTRRDVTITAGETNIVRVDLPVVPLAINAQPWADVWLDGRSVGATPIGALPTPIGRHDLVFRHPQLGERRSSVVVTLERPARVGIDLRRNE